jgi:hypothetical protein
MPDLNKTAALGILGGAGPVGAKKGSLRRLLFLCGGVVSCVSWEIPLLAGVFGVVRG